MTSGRNAIVAIMEKGLKWIESLWQTFLSIVKIMLQSKFCTRLPNNPKKGTLLVLGNGPSLRPLIETKPDLFKDKDLLAVNYAVLSEYYTQLKPQYYLVADPIFFTDETHCNRLFDAMVEKTDWDMCLLLSFQAKNSRLFQEKIAKNKSISVYYFNMTPIEGFKCFSNWCYKKGLGMPRPRNVLVPSIMSGLRFDYKEILVAGADHSWLKEIWVNEDNIVMEDLNHFYDKKGSEQYVSTKHLHDLLLSMHIAFKSYHIINDYARSVGAKIYNITQGSYIDAFERRKIN